MRSRRCAPPKPRAREAGDERLRSFALGWQAQVYERGQRRAEALDLTRRALFAAQTGDAADALYRWQWQLGRLRRAEGDDEGALREYRASASTLARMRAEGTAPLAGEQSFARDVEPLYDELVDLLLYRASTREDASEKQALLAEARNTIEDQKAAELRDYFSDECLDSERRAAPESVPGALVVYPILLPDRMELVIGSARGLESISVPVGRAGADRRGAAAAHASREAHHASVPAPRAEALRLADPAARRATGRARDRTRSCSCRAVRCARSRSPRCTIATPVAT